MNISLQDDDVRPVIELYQQFAQNTAQVFHELGDKFVKAGRRGVSNDAYNSYMEFTQDWILNQVFNPWSGGSRSLVAYGESFAIGDQATEVCEDYQEELKSITRSAFMRDHDLKAPRDGNLSLDVQKDLHTSVRQARDQLAALGDEFACEMQQFISENPLMNAVLQLGRSITSESIDCMGTLESTLRPSQKLTVDTLFSQDEEESSENPFTLSTHSEVSEEDLRKTFEMYGDLCETPAPSRELPKSTPRSGRTLPQATPRPSDSTPKLDHVPDPMNPEDFTKYFQGL